MGLFRVLAVTAMAMAVAAAPALAQTSGGFPDYVLEEDGTVVIDGDGATDCPSFAAFLEQGDLEPPAGNPSQQAQRVLEQCGEAGLLPSGGTTPIAPASSGASAADGEGGGLPDTGGPDLPALLVVSSAVAVASGLLVRKVAAE
jgi:hypothetical protein